MTKSVDRVLALIEALGAASAAGASLMELVDRTDLDKATVTRLLATCVHRLDRARPVVPAVRARADTACHGAARSTPGDDHCVPGADRDPRCNRRDCRVPRGPATSGSPSPAWKARTTCAAGSTPGRAARCCSTWPARQTSRSSRTRSAPRSSRATRPAPMSPRCGGTRISCARTSSCQPIATVRKALAPVRLRVRRPRHRRVRGVVRPCRALRRPPRARADGAAAGGRHGHARARRMPIT